MNRLTLLYSILLFPLAGNAQLSPDPYVGIMDKNRITLQDSNRNKSIFYIDDYNRAAKANRTYYWYTARTIQQSQGAYSGKVLHGTFERFYPDKKIAEKGQFKKGMKQGKWNMWTRSGSLSKTSTWKKSRENGPYTVYDASGKIKEKGRYKDGQADGKVLQVDADSEKETFGYFNKGKAISREEYIQQKIMRRTGNYLGKKWKTVFSRKSKKD